MSPVVFLLLCVAVLLGTVVLAVCLARSKVATIWVYCLVLAACLAAAVTALAVLTGRGGPFTVALPLGLPWVGANFRLDALSAFFLLVINLGGATASLYGLGYGAHEEEPHRVLPFFAAFLAGMNLVLLAGDAFVFLLSWEFMSLASWALVMAHHHDPENRRAGYIYLLMASFGTLALLLAFGLLAGPGGDFAFEAIRQGTHSPVMAALVLVLVLVGAGSKAGLVPLHVWLPLAHPAAPSHVSALMSGVMTKVAIYAFIRVVFDLVGPLPWWSGMLILAFGGASAVLGVLQAIMQDDLKRLLAYSTIENIGIIFVGLGLALAFRSNGMAMAAALALTAALFHVLNHSFFKSLLFFGAGAVLTASGERRLERLGGLIHRMPVTSFLFLTGCVAISALPPLNGFVSEWLTFQAVLLSPDLPQWGLKIMVPAVGGTLALAAALAAATFVKAFGITFLGRPRSEAARTAHEVDRFSLAAMAILGLLCLLAGILPGFVIDMLAPVTRLLAGGAVPEQSALPWLSIVPAAKSGSSYNGLLVFLFITLSALLATWAIHRFASHRLRRAPAWDCGFPDPSPLTQYSGSSFAQPIRRVFVARAFGVHEKVAMPAPGDVRPARFALVVPDPVWDRLYQPLCGVVDFVAQRINHLQFLTIRRYLSLVFFALVFLLLVLAIWS
ncbi:hydrogenase 4 subunit B [Mesorhizobium sp. L-8-10]|uniref:hydrogenase 4 subunit B n=1 Tax=Mesorhizobium sp. L-8-10 TaxID=2744523 RepID=UPI00192684F6|nr:hydrogenase 4 subunit B [Mesorhizobium sp. L-8-10]BCH35265.1 hydrogenase 4 subunit B [Mesorhizobium sp. L-8-10]